MKKPRYYVLHAGENVYHWRPGAKRVHEGSPPPERSEIIDLTIPLGTKRERAAAVECLLSIVEGLVIELAGAPADELEAYRVRLLQAVENVFGELQL